MKTLNIVLGLAVGAGICLLMTTDKGEEMREEIGDSLKDIMKKMDELGGKLGAQAHDLKKSVGKEIEGLSDETRKRVMDILHESSDATDKMKKNVSKMMA